MLFSEALQSLPNNLSDAQINELYTELKNLDNFFNESYEEGDKFANIFLDKFSEIFKKYGFSADAEEVFLETLYEVEDLKNLAMNMIVTIRNIAYDSDFAAFAYEKMLEEWQSDRDY